MGGRASPGSREWTAFGLGGLMGLAVGLLFARRSPAPGGEQPEKASSWDRWSRALEEAVEGASGGLAAARDRLVPPTPLELDGVRKELAGWPGAGGVRVRSLGEGIVEVAGTVRSEDDGARILRHLSAAPGVEVVVNRIWTPASADPEAEGGRAGG